MTSENFCYWLQGYFEIQRPTTMGQWEVECMRRHVNLVIEFQKSNPPRYDSEATAFVAGLHSMLNFVTVTFLEDGTLESLKLKLNKIFKHEIDTPDVTGALQAIHDGTDEPRVVHDGFDKLPPAEFANLPYWDPRSPNYDPKARC